MPNKLKISLLSLLLAFISLNTKSNDAPKVARPIVAGINYSETVLSPYEAVAVIAREPLPKYAPIANSEGDYAAAVPALYLYWLKEKAATKTAYKAASVTVNVLGLVTGVGVAANAATWTVRILGALDATAGAVAVGFDALPIEQVIINKYGATSPEHDFIKNIQLGLTIYNGVSAGANLLQLPQKFDEALTYWQANKQRLVNEAAVTNEQVVVIDNLFQGASGANNLGRQLDLIAEEALGGHSIARHGPQLTLAEMEQRVLGTHPTIPQSRSALRFESAFIHQDAVNKAYNQYVDDIEVFFTNPNNTYKEWTFDYGLKVGNGYTNTGTLSAPIIQAVTSNKVTISFKRTTNSTRGYRLESAFPDIR